MKKGCVLFLLTVLSVANAFPQGHAKTEKSFLENGKMETRNRGTFLYTLTTLSEPYADLTGATSINNGELWDDPGYTVPISFPFELNGNEITYLQFYGVGTLLVSATNDPEVLTAVFPYEMDLIDRGDISGVSESPLSYKVDGAPGNRILKVEWKNAGSYYEVSNAGTANMYVNLQLWLYEGSNMIEFRYGDSFIDNPALFYDVFGVRYGVVDVNENAGLFINPHFFTGPLDMPSLTMEDVTIEDTPAPETVYRLSIGLPLTVDVTGTNSTSSCDPNGTATAVASNGAPPYTYAWSNGASTATIFQLNAGTYAVTATDDNGATATGSIIITGIDPMLLNISATDETAVNANDGTATVVPSDGSPPYTYLWSNGESNASISGLAPGVYSVIVTDSEGCTATESTVVNAFECSGLLVEAQVIHSTCFQDCNGSIVITGVVNGTEPFSFLWNNGSTSTELNGLCPGTYTLTVTDAAGCEVTESYLITEPAELFANGGSTNETANGAEDGTAWAVPFGGVPPYTYAWSNSSTDSLITKLMPGMYTIVVTDANGCTDIDTVQVLPFFCSGTLASETNNLSCFESCDGTGAVFLAGGLGPFGYAWDTGDTTFSILNLCAGTYTVTLTDLGENCSYATSIEITQPDTLVITVDEIIHITDTTSSAISISVSGGNAPYVYAWEGPGGFVSADEDISGVVPGLYSIHVIDTNGCFAIIDSLEIKDESVGIPPIDLVEVRIFPNPAKDQVIIDIEEVTGFRILLRSFDGRTMQTWFEEKILDLNGIPSGMYMLQGISGEKIFRERVLILR